MQLITCRKHKLLPIHERNAITIVVIVAVDAFIVVITYHFILWGRSVSYTSSLYREAVLIIWDSIDKNKGYIKSKNAPPIKLDSTRLG
jgi:hypothetical protein